MKIKCLICGNFVFVPGPDNKVSYPEISNKRRTKIKNSLVHAINTGVNTINKRNELNENSFTDIEDLVKEVFVILNKTVLLHFTYSEIIYNLLYNYLSEMFNAIEPEELEFKLKETKLLKAISELVNDDITTTLKKEVGKNWK